MSLQDIINDFQTILDRDDCTAAAAQTYVIQGIQRIQRDCRLPSMERAQIINPAVDMAQFPIPADLIQIIDVIGPHPNGLTKKALDKISYRSLVTKDPLLWPQWYARMQTQLWVAGVVPAGAQLELLYYGNFSPFASLSGENELSASTPDLAVYAGLSYAADDFEHPNADRWEARYQAIKAEVMQMAADLEGEGGPQAVQPIHSWED